MRACAVLVLITVWVADSASAQTATAGPEVFGIGALSQLWDDEGSLGRGGVFGGGVGYRLSDRIGVEVQVLRQSHERKFDSAVVFQATSTLLSGRLLYHFRDGRVRPYLGGSLGAFQYDRNSEFPVFQPGPGGFPIQVGAERFHSSGRELTCGAAFGVTVLSGERLFIRPEVVLHISNPSNFSTITYGAAAGVKW